MKLECHSLHDSPGSLSEPMFFSTDDRINKWRFRKSNFLKFGFNENFAQSLKFPRPENLMDELHDEAEVSISSGQYKEDMQAFWHSNSMSFAEYMPSKSRQKSRGPY